MAEEKPKKAGHAYIPPRWGYCPGCFRERKYTVNNEMVQHRIWQAPTPEKPELPFGEMIPCPGSGKRPLNISMS